MLTLRGNMVVKFIPGNTPPWLTPPSIPDAVTVRCLRDSVVLGTTDEVLFEKTFAFNPGGGTNPLNQTSYLLETWVFPFFNNQLQTDTCITPEVDVFVSDRIRWEVKSKQLNAGIYNLIYTADFPIMGFHVIPQAASFDFLDSTIDSFWTTGSLTGDRYLTSSISMSAFLNLSNYVPPTGSTFKPTNEGFSIRVGDQFRFEGLESKVHTVMENAVISQTGATSGSIIVKVDPPVRPETQLDKFLIRRFNEDGSSIIIDLVPPSSSFSTTKGYLKNTFINQELENSINTILADLVEKGVIPSGG